MDELPIWQLTASINGLVPTLAMHSLKNHANMVKHWTQAFVEDGVDPLYVFVFHTLLGKKYLYDFNTMLIHECITR